MKYIQDTQQTKQITTFAVYLGRGNGVARKFGNRIYRQTIKETKPIYREARGNKAKAKVASDLVRYIQKQGGVFYYKLNNAFVEAPKSIILLKVKQALREKYESSSDNTDYSNSDIQSILNNSINNCKIKPENGEGNNPVKTPVKTPVFKKEKGLARITIENNQVKEAVSWQIHSNNTSYHNQQINECSLPLYETSYPLQQRQEEPAFPSLKGVYSRDQAQDQAQDQINRNNAQEYQESSKYNYATLSSSKNIPQLIKSDDHKEGVRRVTNDLIMLEEIGPILEEPNINEFNIALCQVDLPSDINMIFQEI